MFTGSDYPFAHILSKTTDTRLNLLQEKYLPIMSSFELQSQNEALFLSKFSNANFFTSDILKSSDSMNILQSYNNLLQLQQLLQQPQNPCIDNKKEVLSQESLLAADLICQSSETIIKVCVLSKFKNFKSFMI